MDALIVAHEHVFQPVKQLDTGSIDHYEMLTRPTGVPDVQAYFEKMPSTQEIELDVANMEFAARLQRQRQYHRIDVNISGHTLASRTARDHIAAIMRATGGDYVGIELTEHRPFQLNSDTMHMLRSTILNGGHVALDDVGAGYSTLAMALRLPITALKIDGKLLLENQRDGTGSHLLHCIMNIARQRRLTVVAEAIEDHASAQFAKDLGATLGQGWLLGRPSSIMQKLKQHTAETELAI